jgi:hypothetical protein
MTLAQYASTVDRPNLHFVKLTPWHVERITTGTRDSSLPFRLPFKASESLQCAAISVAYHMPASLKHVVQLGYTPLVLVLPLSKSPGQLMQDVFLNPAKFAVQIRDY